jgi:hypothetical protein
MSLLAPGDALLAFIAGGLVLLVLYILKLRRRPLRVSSIIHWNPAAADAQANEPFQRLRPSWLLLLHLLILLLLSIAAGQPVWKVPDDAAAARTILIIDASASMNAVDSPSSPSRFDLALQRAQTLVDKATSGGNRSVAIIAAAAEPALVSGFTTAASLANSALSGVAPTDQPGNLQGAMQLAQSIASTSSEQDETGSTRIVLLTDAIEPTNAPGTLVLRSALPVSLERIGQSTPDVQPLNRGITRLSARRDGPGSTALRIFVQVSSNRPAEAGTDQIPLSLTLQGRSVAQRVLEVNLAKGADNRTATTTFELPQVGLGLLEVAITQPDALASDNAAAMFIDPPLNPALILVQPPAGTSPVPASNLLLGDVVSELALRKLTRMTPQEFDTAAAQGALGDADIVLFDHTTPFKAPAIPTIAFGASLTTAGIERKDVPNPPTSLFWQRTHPLLASISLESLVIDDPYVLSITPAPGVSVEELLTCRDGPVMVSTTGGGPRRVVCAFDLGRTNWLLQPSFPVFLSEAIRFLLQRTDESAGKAFSTMQPVFVRMSGATPITIDGPFKRVLDAAGTNASGEAAAGTFTRTGIYTARQQGSADSTIAVNLCDAVESLMNPVTISTATASQAAAAQREGTTGQPTWGLFVAAAALLLSLEWLLFARDLRA